MKTKLDKYARRNALKKAGYQLMSSEKSSLYRGSENLVFDNLKALESHARNITVSGSKDDPSAWDRNDGFYCDADDAETFRMVVFQWGKHWFGGCVEWESVVVDPDPAEDRDTAARWAYSLTERLAEDSKDADAIFQARRELEDNIEETKEEIHSLYEKARQWVSALRGETIGSKLCQTIRETIATLRTDAWKQMEKLREMQTRLAAMPEV